MKLHIISDLGDTKHVIKVFDTALKHCLNRDMKPKHREVKVRKGWGDLKPTPRIVPSKKVYRREKKVDLE